MTYKIKSCLNGYLLESGNEEVSLVYKSAEDLCQNLVKILKRGESMADASVPTLVLDAGQVPESFQKILKTWISKTKESDIE